jgi:replicative DNA helicase
MTEPVVPPHNLEAEQAFLGALLLSNDVYGRVCDTLKPEHFYEDLHGRIYEIIRKTIIEGRVATPVSIQAFLPDIDLGGVTVKQYVVRLASSATTIMNAVDYSKIIIDLAMRRDLIALGHKIITRATDTPVDDSPAMQIEDASREISDLGSASMSKKSEPVSISVAAAQAVHEANEIRAGRMKLDIIHTGIRDLDTRMGGIMRGNHIVIAGRPGMAKTGLAVQIAMNIARRHPVLYFSMEMSNMEISHRAMSNLAYRGFDGVQLPYQVMRDPTQLSNEQMLAWIEAEEVLRPYGLQVDETAALSIEQIAMRSKLVSSRLQLQGKKLGGIFIDHLGLVKPPRNIASRVHQIEHITNGAKQLAKDVDAPVFSLAQLSRAVEQRDDKRPQLADLRDSGSIEQDADFVIGVYREDYYVQKGMWKPVREGEMHAGPNDLEARILKNRHGGEANVLLWCDMPHNVIGDLHR